MNDSRELFLNTHPGKLFFRVAIPGSIAMVASALYQLIDGVLVGRALGEISFAALNLAMPFVIINFALSDLIGVGSAVPISIALGKNDDEEANNIFTCSILMIMTTGLLMGLFLFFAAPLLLSVLGADGELLRQGVLYIRSYAVLSPIITLPFALDNYLKISGKVKLSMVMNIVSCLLSVILEIIFLFLLNLGIVGAGLACSLSFAVVTIFGLVYFKSGKLQLKYRRPRFSFRMAKTIISAGMPIFLSNMAGRITSIAMNAILLHFGGSTAVSVYGVLMYTDGLVQPLIYGLCDSLQPAVGCNYGALRYDRVKSIEKYCFSTSAIVSVISAFLIFIFPMEIAELFMDGEAGNYSEMAFIALRIFSMSLLFRWFSFAAQSFTVAIEKPKAASILSVSTALVFPMLLILILYPLKLTGVWLNIPLTHLLASVLSAIILAKLSRQLKESPKTLAEGK